MARDKLAFLRVIFLTALLRATSTSVNPVERDDGGEEEKAARKMFNDVATKIWKGLAVVDVPRGWALPYCARYIEIDDDLAKVESECRHGGVDWDCVFVRLGGGQEDFEMATIVSLFRAVLDRRLRAKLLRGADKCDDRWKKYKSARARRLARSGASDPAVDEGREEDPSRASSKRFAEARRSRNGNRFARYDVDERNELEDRVELTLLKQLADCLIQETMRACENVVLKEVQKLI